MTERWLAFGAWLAREFAMDRIVAVQAAAREAEYAERAYFEAMAEADQA